MLKARKTWFSKIEILKSKYGRFEKNSEDVDS
jgi:hypothetical protein